jgi:hypothetical protein
MLNGVNKGLSILDGEIVFQQFALVVGDCDAGKITIIRKFQFRFVLNTQMDSNNRLSILKKFT